MNSWCGQRHRNHNSRWRQYVTLQLRHPPTITTDCRNLESLNLHSTFKRSNSMKIDRCLRLTLMTTESSNRGILVTKACYKKWALVLPHVIISCCQYLFFSGATAASFHVYRSQIIDTHTNTHPISLVWRGDQPVTDAAAYTTHNYTRRTSMSSVGFELAIPPAERREIYALDHTATGIGCRLYRPTKFKIQTY
jgi:hypothetical protein